MNIRPPKFTFWKRWQSLNSHLIFLNCEVANWFRDGVPGIPGGVDGAIAEILRFKSEVRADRLVMTGSSMGGFGAMLYGSLTMADCVLVFGVEPLLGIPGGKTEHTRNHLQHAYPDISQLQFKPPTTLFYGGMDIIDTLGASLVAQRWESDVVCIPEAQHDTPDFLDRSGRLSLCFSSLVDGAPMPKFGLDEGGATDLALVNVLWRINAPYVVKDWLEIKNIAIDRSEVDRSNLLKFILGSALFRLGDLSGARSLLTSVVDELPGYWEGWGTISALYVREKNLDLAEVAAIKAVKLRPHRSMAHAQLGNIYKHKGDLEKAYVHYCWARALNPDKQEYLSAVSDVAHRLSKTVPEMPCAGDVGSIDAAIRIFADYELHSLTLPSDLYE